MGSLLVVRLLWDEPKAQKHDDQEEDHSATKAQGALPKLPALEGVSEQGVVPVFNAAGALFVALELQILYLYETERLEAPPQVGEVRDPASF